MKVYSKLSFRALQFFTCLMDQGDMVDDIFTEPIEVRFVVPHGLKGKEYQLVYHRRLLDHTCVIVEFGASFLTENAHCFLLFYIRPIGGLLHSGEDPWQWRNNYVVRGPVFKSSQRGGARRDSALRP